MGADTKIEWAHHTFNPWIGCMKVGPGCDHCYAEALMDRRYGRVRWGAGQPRVRTSAANWKLPLRWDRACARAGIRQRVFCASLADVFDNEVDPAWRDDLFELIRITPNLDWLLLTKRIGNVIAMIDRSGSIAGNGSRYVPDNVWIGATIVKQEEADRDIPKLLATPAAKRFLSMEPLLGPVELNRWFAIHQHWLSVDSLPTAPWCPPYPKHWWKHQALVGVGYRPPLDWIIVGGESGPGARPMHPDWARSLRDQCEAARVPFLFKQWGEWGPDCGPDGHDRNGLLRDRIMEGAGPCAVLVDGEWQMFADGYAAPIELCSGHGEFVYRLGKKANGRLLDDVQHDGVPG